MNSQLPLNFFMFITASSPIVLVLILMIGFKWSGARAGSLTWLYTLIISLIVFKADRHILAFSNTKGMLMTIYALYIIWGALFLYNITWLTAPAA